MNFKLSFDCNSTSLKIKMLLFYFKINIYKRIIFFICTTIFLPFLNEVLCHNVSYMLVNNHKVHLLGKEPSLFTTQPW